MNGAAVETVEVEALPPEIKQKIDVELAPYRQGHLTERKPITNDAEEMVNVVVVAQRKRDYKELEEIRDRLVRPYNTIVKQINKAFKMETDVADEDWRLRDQDLSAYRTAKQAAIDAANRKAIADAEEARRKKEAEEEAARVEAKRLRDEAERVDQERINQEFQAEMDRLAAEQKIKDEEAALLRAKQEGDARAAREAQAAIDRATREEEERARKAEQERLDAVAEKARLEKAAIKQDSKADIAASKATMIAPTIQVNDSVGTRTLSDGSSVGTRKVEEVYFDNGLPVFSDHLKKKLAEHYKNEPRLKDIEIPEHCWLLDMSKLVKLVKDGFVIKGISVRKGSATTAGR